MFWDVVPPEVSSILLSSGPGPASLLAAGEAWRALALHYTEAAAELSDILSALQTGAWQGPSAEQYASANQPFLSWLTTMGTLSELVADRHDAIAAGYSAALAAMPTLIELAANHATHTALVATNFLGINSIPIVLNEADYLRMWAQAAAVMDAYQGASEAALGSLPTASAAPQILSSDSAAATAVSATAASGSSGSGDVTGWLLQELDYLIEDLQRLAATVPEPWRGALTQVLDSASSVVGSQVFTIAAYSILDPTIYFGPFLAPLAPAAAASATAAVAGIATPVTEPENPSAATTEQPRASTARAAGHQHALAVALTPGTGTASVAPSSSPAAPAPAPTTATPAHGAVRPGFYAVGGGPDREGFTPTEGGRAAQSITESMPDIAAASAAAPALRRQTTRRRRKARQYRYEALSADAHITRPGDPGNAQVPAQVSESRRGTDTLAHARGLIDQQHQRYDATEAPTLPQTWDENR